jgi:FixJ family two-component response regulator
VAMCASRGAACTSLGSIDVRFARWDGLRWRRGLGSTMCAISKQSPIVAIVDDDKDVRDALADLLHSVGLQTLLFASVHEFVDRAGPARPSCLVLDVRLPGRSGLDFQKDLINNGVNLPIVFISGHADVPMSVGAMKAGAVEFLTKPVRSQDLLDAIQLAIEKDRAQREGERAIAEMRQRYNSLTTREREVMLRVCLGHPNKRIATELGISQGTVKLHRGQVMRKMKVESLADLVRIADKIAPDPRPKSPSSITKV